MGESIKLRRQWFLQLAAKKNCLEVHPSKALAVLARRYLTSIMWVLGETRSGISRCAEAPPMELAL